MPAKKKKGKKGVSKKAAAVEPSSKDKESELDKTDDLIEK